MPLSPSDLLVGQITEEEIKEFCHTPQSMRTDGFTLGACDLEMTFKVPGDKLKPFLQWCLGVNYVDTANQLRRTCPMFHPVHCWAWAKSVSVQGQQYDGDDVAAVIWDFQSLPAKWKQYEATVTFDIPRFRVAYDGDVDAEHRRFLSKDLAPDARIVTVENGQVHYDANQNDAWKDMPHNATIPIARKEGAGIRMTWWHVPLEFIQEAPPGEETIDGLPEKFMVAQGKCNSEVIFGKDKETLLLDTVKLDTYVSPVMTDQIGDLYYMVDVHMDFLYTRQLDADMGKTGETRRGWNCLLGPQMKYWYTRNAANGRPVIPSVNLKKLFTHWSDRFE